MPPRTLIDKARLCKTDYLNVEINIANFLKLHIFYMLHLKCTNISTFKGCAKVVFQPSFNVKM